MEEPVRIDYATHYDDKYWTARKTFVAPDGSTQVYHGPGLAWEGFQAIADALAPLIPGKSLLDIGCGGGDLAARFLAKGYDAYGIDISEYAIKNCVSSMKGRIARRDITEQSDRILLPVFEKFDVVMATDLLEHIYEEDLNETFDWMMSKSKRWLFFCVAVATGESHKNEFVAKKGEPIPPMWEGTAISGHVNVRHWHYWARFFRDRGLKTRWDLMYLLQMKREQDPAWRNTPGWNMSTTFLCEK